jgi:hypothetical protein
MKRHIPGLNTESKNAGDFLEGLFLVRVDHVNYRWHPQKPCYALRFAVLEPEEFRSRQISGRLYCTPKALWRLNWFLRDFEHDADLLGRDDVDERALVGLKGVVRTSRRTLAGRSFLNLDGFAASADWEDLSMDRGERTRGEKGESNDLQLHTD